MEANLSLGQRQQLALVLGRIPQMADDSSRRAIVALLPPSLAHSIPLFPAAGLEIFSIVKACLDHREGIAQLLETIGLFAGDCEVLAQARRLASAYGLLGAGGAA